MTMSPSIVPWRRLCRGKAAWKVSFDTTVQNNLTLQARQANHQPLPFAASILDPSGKEIGVVGQGSMMFISDANAKRAIVEVERRTVFGGSGTGKNKGNVCR
jgi:outer membrane usher protein